jgi:hypothetical protein
MTELYEECSGFEWYCVQEAPMRIRCKRSSCLPFPWSKSTFHHMVTAYNVALRTGMLRHCCSPFHDDLPHSIGLSSRSRQDRTVRCSESGITPPLSAAQVVSELREIVIIPTLNKKMM